MYRREKECVIGISLLHQLAGFPPCEIWEEHAGKVRKQGKESFSLQLKLFLCFVEGEKKEKKKSTCNFCSAKYFSSGMELLSVKGRLFLSCKLLYQCDKSLDGYKKQLHRLQRCIIHFRWWGILRYFMRSQVSVVCKFCALSVHLNCCSVSLLVSQWQSGLSPFALKVKAFLVWDVEVFRLWDILHVWCSLWEWSQKTMVGFWEPLWCKVVDSTFCFIDFHWVLSIIVKYMVGISIFLKQVWCL